jgi:DNA-binding transcriptional LysR family regulator
MSTNNLLDSLPDMAVFARVVDAGSFSAAARQLGLTPSAVSRQVARLEAVLPGDVERRARSAGP